MMSCPRHLELSAYLDHALEAAEQQQLSRHLQDCAVCSRQLAALLEMQQDFQQLPSPALGFDLAARIEQQGRTDAQHRRRPVRSLWLRWGQTGAVVAASLATGIWLGGLAISSSAVAPSAGMVRVFDPVPPGGLCAATELCRISKGIQ